MPAPWFIHPCSRRGEGETVDGVLCYADEREFDVGEERPFLVAHTPGAVRPPPPEHTSAPFLRPFGTHRPLCGGRCLVSVFDENNALWITVLLLLVPSLTWFAFVGPAMVEEFGSVPVIIAGLLLLSSSGFLCATWLIEPGILAHVEIQDLTEPDKPAKLIYVVLHGQYFLRRTFRAQNSRFTNSCIEGFDHHCPYVGNAIGKRNYRYFILLLTSVVLLCGFVVASAVALVFTRMDHDNDSLGRALKKSAGATVLGGFSFLMGLSVATLLGYHIRLMCLGLSTYEDLKVSFSSGLNPHDEGCWRNCMAVWCSPHYPSRVAGVGELPPLSDPEQQLSTLNESLLFSPSTPVAPRTSPRPNLATSSIQIGLRTVLGSNPQPIRTSTVRHQGSD